MIYTLSCSPAVFAQQVSTEDPVATAPIRLGALALDPRIGIHNVGVETNIFNSPSNPQKDFTFTLSPGTQMWLRTGKGLLSVEADLDIVHFNRFASERSWNSSATGQFEIRFNRIRPYISARTLNTRERPGYEIDARARHFETDFHAGGDVRTGSKGIVRVDYRHLSYYFAGDALFAGRPLNQELNRTLKAVDATWRQRLTVLTTWVIGFSRDSERFQFEKLRNSDSLRVNSGFELGRFALIRGSAFIGYRKLMPAEGGILPEFSGLTADVDVNYTAPTQTRLGIAVDRDVQYSYERATPYYLHTGWTGTLTQRIVGRWDFQLNGGRDRLSYQALDLQQRRNDFIGRFGGGIGYTIGDQVRVSFDVQSLHRRSDEPGRAYGGTRAGMSVTYGY